MKAVKTLLLVLLPMFLIGQKWEGGLMLGASNYQGDIASTNIWSLQETQMTYGAFARYHFMDRISLRANFLMGKMTGDDMNYVSENAWRADRNLNFSTPFQEATFKVEWNILGGPTHKKGLRPYAFAGIGALFTQPTVNNLSEGAPEYQANHYSTNHLSVPVGFGVNYDINDRIVIGMEIASRVPVTDYMDGISESGGADVKDYLSNAGVTISYRFGEESYKERALKDLDNDGTPDIRDQCPLVPGELRGCPDADKDGVRDSKDQCPDTPGKKRFKGCPDTDNDGTVDSKDECPNYAGPKNMNGCPDTDKDGIADKDDNCPLEAGITSNSGCPELKEKGAIEVPVIEEEIIEVPEVKLPILDLSVREVRFETAQAEFNFASMNNVNEVIKLMNDNPSLRLLLIGHTDDKGAEASNKVLSEKRAKRCFDFMTSKGVDASRMSYEGRGETQPNYDNGTSYGRTMNRRVEFILIQGK